MLLRWEKSVLEKTSLPLSPPPSPHTSHPPTKEEQPIKRHDSPLFEELSDEEFEETRKTADTAEVEKGTCMSGDLALSCIVGQIHLLVAYCSLLLIYF